MAFEPGHKLSPGRPKGSINQRTRSFQETLAEHDFDLAEALLDIYRESIKFYDANKTDPFAGPQSLKLVLDAAKEIGSYSQPKLKAVEVQKTNPLDGLTPQEKLELMREAVKMLEAETKDVTPEIKD